jgi:hypothetical protein
MIKIDIFENNTNKSGYQSNKQICILRNTGNLQTYQNRLSCSTCITPFVLVFNILEGATNWTITSSHIELPKIRLALLLIIRNHFMCTITDILLIDTLHHRAHSASVEGARLWRHGCRCTWQVGILEQCVYSKQTCNMKVALNELQIGVMCFSWLHSYSHGPLQTTLQSESKTIRTKYKLKMCIYLGSRYLNSTFSCDNIHIYLINPLPTLLNLKQPQFQLYLINFRCASCS